MTAQYRRTGIGGAGNRRLSNTSTATVTRPFLISQHVSQNSSTASFSFGIGGAGNRCSTKERPALTPEERLLSDKLRREAAAAPRFHGVGGAGNSLSSTSASSVSSNSSSQQTKSTKAWRQKLARHFTRRRSGKVYEGALGKASVESLSSGSTLEERSQ